MNPLFYLILFILMLGLGGSAQWFFEWCRRHYQYPTLLLWSLGILGLNWYQVPTLIALAGQQTVLTDFNFFFSLTLPIAFLGFGLIYLGSLSLVSKIKPWLWLLFSIWFMAAFIFYGFYYRGNLPFQSVWPIIGSNLLFFTPIFILNFSIAIVLYYKKALRLNFLSLKIGLGLYALAACMGLARSGLSLYFGLNYPPNFAAFRFFSTPFIIAQAIGLILFLISFFFIRKNIERLS